MLPVQYLARVLDIPLARDAPDRPVSGLVGVQPTQNATERDQAAPRLTFAHLTIGQALTGQVKSLSKGISLVEIDGQTVAMRLPPQTTVGDTLRLRFAGHLPQPVFLLETAAGTAADTPQLSQTARMLSEIMQHVPERALPTLIPTAALLNQPTAVPAELALALRTALVRSGLFYESHLANWVVGQDNLDGLMQEPQNRQASETARSAAALALLNSSNLADRSVNPMHTLLSQQLQVLESPQFAWRGELWPGQMLEWQIRQETGSSSGESASMEPSEDQTGWESHLKLSLPRLGNVDIYIKLDTQQAFSIRMVPEQPEITPLLQANQAHLVEQLTTAGCELHAVTVQNDAKT